MADGCALGLPGASVAFSVVQGSRRGWLDEEAGNDREARTTVLGEDFRTVRPADAGGMLTRIPDEVGNGENFVDSQIEWHD